MFFFFFFQAEDGIRDTSVTGVQTCALPISSAPSPDLVVWIHYETTYCAFASLRYNRWCVQGFLCVALELVSPFAQRLDDVWHCDRVLRGPPDTKDVHRGYPPRRGQNATNGSRRPHSVPEHRYPEI